MPATATLEDILLAQIEHHRTEVFYNLDPMRYGSKFIHRLPGSVKASIAWRAAPSPGADFSAYSLVVCNFPSIIKNYEERGWKSAYFSPAYDPVMDEYAMRDERTIDLLFVGGYTRHHRHRAAMLEQVASLRDQHSVVYCLDRSRMTRLAESPFGYLFFLGEHRRPRSVQHVSHAPVFGRQLYEMLGRARIVLNGAIDMAGEERGNMRCFETLGCGALLLSDAGAYPKGMVDGQTMVTYDNLNQVTAKIQNLLADEPRRAEIAARGHTMIASCFDKGSQWQQFQQLVV